jgi:hypothetical protein
MLEQHRQVVLSRRNLLLLAGAGFASWNQAYSFAAKEFWETKDPAEWNSDEIAKLLSKSPWAKTTTAESVKTQKNSMPNPSNPSTMPGTRSSRNSGGLGRMPGDGSGSNRNPSTKIVTSYKGVVLWESAAPVRAALKTKLPDGFEGQYVLGVSGVPLAKSDSKSAIDRVRQVTTLQTKGKPQPLEAGTVQEDTSNGTVYLFGFSREALAIAKDDKEIVFTTHMGKVMFTAKFNPKDMLYHGELAA